VEDDKGALSWELRGQKFYGRREQRIWEVGFLWWLKLAEIGKNLQGGMG